jgi:phage shock protein PspC (stress-responsive transcriptional regulator)
MNDFAASNENESVNDSDPQPQGSSGSLPRRSPLRRVYRGRMLGGVAAGIGDYLGVDANIVRVAFAVLTVAGGAGIPVYIACLFLIPEEGTDASLASSLFDSVQTR